MRTHAFCGRCARTWQAGAQPMSGQSVLDETFRAKLGCSQLFREYCSTALTPLHTAAGMSSANCSAALQLGLASANINICAVSLSLSSLPSSSSSFGFETALSSDVGHSIDHPLQLQMGRCNESAQKWKFGCKHASIDACRDAAAALFPDRCDRDALAFDSKLLEQLTTENRLESILLALTGPSANFSTRWGAASRPANLNFLRGQLLELESLQKQVPHARTLTWLLLMFVLGCFLSHSLSTSRPHTSKERKLIDTVRWLTSDTVGRARCEAVAASESSVGHRESGRCFGSGRRCDSTKKTAKRQSHDVGA